MVRLIYILASTFLYLIPKFQGTFFSHSYSFYEWESWGCGGYLDWNSNGPQSLFVGLCSITDPMFFPFVSFHCHSQMLLFNSQKIKSFCFFSFASFAPMASTNCCLWVAEKPGALPSGSHLLAPSRAFEMGREREKERLKEGRQERERQTDRKNDLLHGSYPSTIQWNPNYQSLI